MGLRRRGNLVWLSMVLSGVALGAFVWVSWPEPSLRIVRLPYGEAMPKSVRTAPERQEPVRTVAAVVPVAAVDATAPELAAAEPQRLDAGPSPVGSEIEDDYAESAEQLGAEPLPGFGHAPAASEDQPVAEAAPQPAEQPAEDEDDPVLDVVIGLPQPSPPHDEP
ncbi:MAG TPA: hypothetical protein VML35_03500 [Gaiellaceae bacterium]|nr:hypothetical protein [Gaiellaceae bacterium]